MALHFERDEFDARLVATRRRLQQDGMAALLIFGPESQYYLTGYDTNGFVFFQCLIVTADDRAPILLTRLPDREQARQTSTVEDIRIWYNAEGKDPTEDLFPILQELGLAGEQVGIERHTFGLNAENYDLIRSRLEPWCVLVDGSDVVRAQRVVKSPAEIAYHRRAAALADDALVAMLETAGGGVFEGDIAAAGSSAILRGDGDPPPSGPVLGSGPRALLLRPATGMRSLDPVDQLTLEFAGTYRRYNACIMRTAAIGEGNARQQRMFEVTRDAILAMTEAARPGNTIGDIDAAHRRVYDANGFEASRMAACGYSLGATWRPSWMDVPPMIYLGNQMPAQAGMVLFLHAILIDADAGQAMSLGHTIALTEGPAEVLSRLTPEYTVCP